MSIEVSRHMQVSIGIYKTVLFDWIDKIDKVNLARRLSNIQTNISSCQTAAQLPIRWELTITFSVV